jgi:hypothetical protein
MSQRLSNLRGKPIAALVTAAGTFAAIAVFGIAANPASQHALRTWKEYVLTSTIFPGALAVLWVLWALAGRYSVRESRLARGGLRIAAVALAALAVDGAVTLGSGTTDTAGPLYPIAMLGTLVGIVLLASDWYRARTMPRWVGPIVAIGWFAGATPIAGNGGAFLILSAAFAAAAAAIRRGAPSHALVATGEAEIAV